MLHSSPTCWGRRRFAAFTGVLLFASSAGGGLGRELVVFHRLDSAIAWNPRIVARLGALRAARWSAGGAGHVSGMAANVSLGLMLGVLPAVLNFWACRGRAPRHPGHRPAGRRWARWDCKPGTSRRSGGAWPRSR